MMIEMDGFSVLLQRKRIKNINLRIRHTGDIQLSAPLKTPLHVIHSFLSHKCAWIKRHLNQLPSTKPQPEKMKKYLLFQGSAYKLQVQETETIQRLELKDDEFHLFVKKEATPTDGQVLITQWYRTQMEQCLPALFEKWQSLIGVFANKVTIKSMKSRWGSCHPVKKYISINVSLIEKPTVCLEYVIVHELVHLLEASHNQRFYVLMTQYLPNWKEIRKQLI